MQTSSAPWQYRVLQVITEAGQVPLSRCTWHCLSMFCHLWGLIISKSTSLLNTLWMFSEDARLPDWGQRALLPAVSKQRERGVLSWPSCCQIPQGQHGTQRNGVKKWAALCLVPWVGRNMISFFQVIHRIRNPEKGAGVESSQGPAILGELVCWLRVFQIHLFPELKLYRHHTSPSA